MWHLRLAQEEDVQAIADLNEASILHNFPRFFPPEQVQKQIDWLRDHQTILDWINHGELWIANDFDDNMLGVAGVRVDGSTAWFGMCYVLQTGEGIAAHLTNERLRSAQRLGARWILSEVLNDNLAGQAHLSRHGFTPTGVFRETTSLPRQSIQLWARSLSNR